MKKHILLLTTGGTIACAPGGAGLEPQRSGIMERELDQLRSYYDITVQDVFCLDSSNITPEEWQKIAGVVFENRAGYDGIVVSHGTDTMAYTASAVTFLLPDIDKPVVFTGSQLPLTDMLSDGPSNLRTAFAMAASGCPGVFVAFDRKVMLGCRAVKVRASGFSAFESVNARYVATVTNRGLLVDKTVLRAPQGPARLAPELCRDVFLLKLPPGLNPAVLDMLRPWATRASSLRPSAWAVSTCSTRACGASAGRWRTAFPWWSPPSACTTARICGYTRWAISFWSWGSSRAWI